MSQEESTDEQLICLNCGNNTFWVYRNTESQELSVFCENCGDPIE